MASLANYFCFSYFLAKPKDRDSASSSNDIDPAYIKLLLVLRKVVESELVAHCLAVVSISRVYAGPILGILDDFAENVRHRESLKFNEARRRMAVA